MPRKGPIADFLTIANSAWSQFRRLETGGAKFKFAAAVSVAAAAAVRVAEIVTKRHSRKMADCQKIGYWAYLLLVLY